MSMRAWINSRLVLAAFFSALIGGVVALLLFGNLSSLSELWMLGEVRRQKLTEQNTDNLRRIATGLEEFAVDHNGSFPASLDEVGPQYLPAKIFIPGSNPAQLYTYHQPAADPRWGNYDIVDDGSFDPSLLQLANGIGGALCSRTTCKYIIYTASAGLIGSPTAPSPRANNTSTLVPTAIPEPMPALNPRASITVHPQIVVEFTVPDSDFGFSITQGPDGGLWFTDDLGNSIGHIDESYKRLERFPLPDPYGNPMSIVAGSDGALWFAEEGLSRIGRVTTSGKITEYSSPWGRIDPYALGSGPDGALWFGISDGFVGRITTHGHFSRLALPNSNADIRSIITGPHRELWLADNANALLYRLDMKGNVTQVVLAGANANAIAACPDDHIWATAYGPLGSNQTYRVYRIRADGSAVRYRLPNPDPSQEAQTPAPSRKSFPVIRVCPGGNCGGSPLPQPRYFGVTSCFKDAVYFRIGSQTIGRIDVKTGKVAEYSGDTWQPQLGLKRFSRILWFHDEIAGKIFVLAIP